jgi:E3 ubiquitin-protein ligase UBR4
MQKKSVLLLTAGGVIRCSEMVNQPMRDSQLLHLSRLLLLLEYLMKHLYDAPPALLEQVIRIQFITNINDELKYPALLGIEDKVNCYIPTASTM